MAEGRSQSDEECTSTQCQHAVLTLAHHLSQPHCQRDAFLCCTTAGAESRWCSLVLIHHHMHPASCCGWEVLLCSEEVLWGFPPYGVAVCCWRGWRAIMGSEQWYHPMAACGVGKVWVGVMG